MTSWLSQSTGPAGLDDSWNISGPTASSTGAPRSASSRASWRETTDLPQPSRAAAALMLPAPTVAENVVRSWGSRQGNGQSPTVRA